MRKRLLAMLLATVFAFMSIGVTAAEDGTALTQEAFKSHSLALSDCIGIIFYMDLSPLTEQEREASYMSFDISGAGTVEERAEYDPTLRNSTGEYYGFTCEVNAIQMADTLTATYHYGNEQTISETYSIRKYIQTFEAYQAYQDETTVALVRALADYGHHTQLFLSVVNNLPLGSDSDQYAPMDQYYTESYDFDFIRSEVEPFAISREKDDTALKSIPYTLILDSRLELCVYFQPTPEFDGTPVFKLDGKPVTAEEKNGRYTVSIPEILPHKIGDTYLITAEADGVNIAAVSISPLSYVYAVLSSSAYANNLQALNAAASIYMYYKAAKAYSAVRNWNLPTYDWAEDNSTVTATRVSLIDASVTETETVNTTSEITKPAACEEPGEITYTASFENTAFEAQTKVVEIPATGHAWGEWTVTTPATCTEAGVETRICANDASHTETRAIEALGHAWGEVTYEWAADNSTVTATRICANNASHIETETVNTTADTTDASCETAGNTTYTATFENEAFEAQIKTVEIPATGHAWGEWTVTTPATCTEAGVETRICANDASHTETRAIEALGHAWGVPTWSWTDGYTAASATFTCSHDVSHTHTVDATVAQNDGLGYTDYTATASFNGQSYSDTKHVSFAAFYLIGPDWTVADINAANEFEVNPSNAAEYMLTVELTSGDQIKVVKVEDGTITAWYPDGLNNEYTVDAGHAGDEKTIYFSETYRNDWSMFGGYIWIDASSQVQLNTFTHSDNLVNVDTYLYRVGNGNAVKLGSLLKVETEGDSAVVSDDVSVTVEKVEANSTVALGSYAKNSSDWTQSTLKFTGEGPVRVTVREGSGTPYTLNLEIVTANNATTATSATSANIVLLNNVSGGLSVSNGKTLYGNGFSVTDTRSNPSGTAGYVNVTNGTVDNVKFIGYEPTTAVASGTSNAGYAPSVRAANGANLYNVYISGGRYALLIDGGTVSLKNTMLDGGAVGNMKLEGGTLVLEDCVTATSTRGGLKGLGIHLTSTNAKIVIKGTFEQHNWLTSNDMPSAYQSMLSGMFSNSTYAYTSGSNKYVNMGILGLIDGQNFYASSMQSQITDDTNNDYGYVEKSAAGSITGTLYTAKASMGSAEMLADPVDERMQHATLPSFTFDYTNKNYIPNTGDDTFCYYDTTTQKVAISLKQSSTEDVFDWDPMILESKKYGQTLGYTVTMNGADYTDQIISFSENGDYTVTYTVTDPYNFDKDVNKSSVVYQKEVKISVTIIEPDAVVYHPEFSYAGDWSSYQATSVSAGGSTYIMPNATGTSDTIASTTVSGTTVYMPIITVAGKNSSGGKYSSGKIYCFAPAFSAINITDKDVNTGEVLYTYNSSTQKWPHNQSATTGPNRDYYGPNSVRDPYGAGTGATYEKYAYNANNGGLCYTSNEIERNVNANTKTVKFFYVGNDGITYYYYIQYKYQAVTYSSCVAEGTQILMADGSQKAVEDVQMGDMVMTWSFENGCYEAAPVAIKWYHGTDDFRVLNLEFSDGTVVRVINTHGFFDRDLNTYAYIREGNADDYLGHTFVKRTPDGDNTEVVLVNSYITEEHVGNYSLQTAYNDNFIAENLLTITAEDHVGRFEYFPIGDNMMYDAEAKARDIETYGLYTYEEFADWLTEEQFIMFNGPYFKVLVGRGVLTYEDILEIIRVNLYANETAQ